MDLAIGYGKDTDATKPIFRRVDDIDGLRYQLVEVVKNINKFESSIKHKSNVFSVVVQNSNLAQNKSVDMDEDTVQAKIEKYKEKLRNSVT